MEKLEIIPAATQVYLSKVSIADMGRAESGIFVVVEMGIETGKVGETCMRL